MLCIKFILLAGQGFNMTLRDTKILSQLIKKNLDLGLNLDTVLEKFEKKEKIQILFLQWE